MIKVKRGGKPPSLTGSKCPGALETADAIKFYRRTANSLAKYDFLAYKADDIVKALNERFHFKCAYCESRYIAMTPVDVEHYRPKGGVEVDRKLKKPGYYWLAADWQNLLPSCIDCNRKRTHDFPDEDPDVRGKANRFPISNPAQRARKPGTESRERRLLLNPCTDDPKRHLEFLTEGGIRPALIKGKPSPMAVASIEVYGLDRPGLISERHRTLRHMEGLMGRIREKYAEMNAPRTPSAVVSYIKRNIRDDIALLKRYADPEEPYSAMAAQVIRRFEAEIRRL